MFGVKIEMEAPVDEGHPVVNMNNPLIPHDHAMFRQDVPESKPPDRVEHLTFDKTRQHGVKEEN